MTSIRDQAGSTAPVGRPEATSGAALQLAMATLGFLVNFWAWALLGPAGPGIKERLRARASPRSPCSSRCR